MDEEIKAILDDIERDNVSTDDLPDFVNWLRERGNEEAVCAIEERYGMVSA
jgi:hypothetical protein